MRDKERTSPYIVCGHVHQHSHTKSSITGAVDVIIGGAKLLRWIVALQLASLRRPSASAVGFPVGHSRGGKRGGGGKCPVHTLWTGPSFSCQCSETEVYFRMQRFGEKFAAVGRLHCQRHDWSVGFQWQREALSARTRKNNPLVHY